MLAAGTGPWQQREWEELNACPLVQPYRCAHPHCLSCNWDGEEADTWVYAAHLGPTEATTHHDNPHFPEAHAIQDRRYVAWLCDDCAAIPDTARWFIENVRWCYPEATIVRNPGSPGEMLLADS